METGKTVRARTKFGHMFSRERVAYKDYGFVEYVGILGAVILWAVRTMYKGIDIR